MRPDPMCHMAGGYELECMTTLIDTATFWNDFKENPSTMA